MPPRPNKKMKKWKNLIHNLSRHRHHHQQFHMGWSESKMKNNKNERAQRRKKMMMEKWSHRKGNLLAFPPPLHTHALITALFAHTHKNEVSPNAFPIHSLCVVYAHRAQSTERERKRPKNVKRKSNPEFISIFVGCLVRCALHFLYISSVAFIFL